MGSFIIFVLAIIAMFAVAIMRMNQEDDGPDPDPFSKDSATRPSRTSGGASPARRRPVPRTPDAARTSDTARTPAAARSQDTARTAGLASAASALAAAAAREAVEERSPAPEAPQPTDLSAPESAASEGATSDAEAPEAAAHEAMDTEAAPAEPAAEQSPVAGTSSGAFYTSSSSSYSVYTPTSVYQSGSSVLKENEAEADEDETGESTR